MSLFKNKLYGFDTESLPTREPNFSAADKVEKRGREYHLYFQESKEGIVSINLHESGKYRVFVHCAANTKNLFFFHAHIADQQEGKVFLNVEESAEIFFVSHLHNAQGSQGDIDIEITSAKNSKVSLVNMHISQGVSNVSIQNTMDGEGARGEIYSIVLGKGQSKTDMQIQNISKANDTYGEIHMRSVLLDESISRMQGAPIVDLGSKNCASHLEQKTLLLSKKARVTSLPLLLVSNNEVEASHSSSVSTFFNDDLFYLQSRGLNREESTKLIVEAFITELFESIPSTNVQECLRENTKEFVS